MRSYKVYQVDWNKVAAWLIPKPWRKSIIIILVKAFLYPLITLHNSFLNYRKAKIYQIGHNGQDCYLEAVLNDKYDFTERRIYIEDAQWHLPTFVFQRSEDKPKYLRRRSEASPIPLYTGGEAGAALNDFVVFIPTVVFSWSTLDEMVSIINSYKLFGTRYSIQLFKP